MKLRTTVSAFAFIAILASACGNNTNTASGSGGTLLKFDLDKGKRYGYDIEMNSTQNYQGRDYQSKMNFGYDMEVLDKTDSATTIRATYTRIAMDIASPSGNITLDSDQPLKDTAASGELDPTTLMKQMFASMKGKSFVMNVAPDGTITGITGVNEMAEAMFNSMSVPEQYKQQMKAYFSQQFNNETLKQSFGNALNIYPNKAVNVGDKWEKKANVTVAGSPVTSATTYTIKSINGDRVTIDVAADVNNGSGTQTGTMVVDADNGLVIEANTAQKLTQPMNINSTMKIQGKEK